ncbi:MAG: hypothetical protein JWM47_3718 [Acidimicrobiales bacterium]|nr:hypothetical protein [Acidimicrobiales bacterium]
MAGRRRKWCVRLRASSSEISEENQVGLIERWVHNKPGDRYHCKKMISAQGLKFWAIKSKLPYGVLATIILRKDRRTLEFYRLLG